MPQHPGRWQNRNKRKQQVGILAGTTAENLRDRHHHLSCLSKRQDVQDGDHAPLSMQQSTGAIQMCPENDVKTNDITSCEKNDLFSHGLLLLNISYLYDFRLPISGSELLFAPLCDRSLHKRIINVPYLPVCR